jgi:hypothetical protein
MKKRNIIKIQYPIVESVIKVVNDLLYIVADMNRRGVSEEVYQGEFKGKTKDGQDIKVEYGYGIRVGLDDFVKKVQEKNLIYGTDRTSE